MVVHVGMKHACMEYPVKAGLIVMMDRRFPKEQNLIIAQKAARFASEGVVGIDIAGPITKEFHVSDLVDSVKIARDAGLKVTIHTGEEKIVYPIKMITNKKIRIIEN